jgi:preprotein translocase subunit SecE
MNRQYKRMMKKEEDRKKGAPRAPVKPPAQKKERTKPIQFFREVIGELRKVAWPTRQEVFSYSLVVIVSCVVIAALVFGMDFVFTKAILGLFGVET